MRFILTNFFLLCLLLIAGLFYYLTMTTPGLQTDIQLLTTMLGGKLQIESAKGKLFSDFSLQNINYHDDSQSAYIKSFTCSWNPLGLLRYKLMINSIRVDQALIKIPNIPAFSTSEKPKTNFLKDITFKQAQFNQVSLQLADAKIEVNGGLEQNWDLRWQATIPQTTTFLADSKGSIFTSGTVVGPFLTPSIKANLIGKNLFFANQQVKQLNAAVNIIIQPKINSSLSLTASGIKIDGYPLQKFDLSISGDIAYFKKALSLHLASVINKRYPILADFSFPQFAGITTLDQPMSGKISSTLRKLDLLANSVKQIKDPQGTLQTTVFLNGTLANPTVTANFNLLNGRVRIPSLGITPRNIFLQGSTNATKQLNFTGRLSSGKGSAQLQGFVDLSKSNYPLTLRVKGSQLQAMNLSEYEINISPDITLMFANQNLTVQGTILIPYAQLTPQSFSGSVTLPTDVVFVDSKTSTELPFSTQLQLTLKLGDKIHLAYHELKTDLAGDVQINQRPGSLINAVGELYTIKGEYKAYGQVLKIKTGRLIYTGGSLMNPGLNISAIKKLKTVNTGGNVSDFSGETSLQAVYTGTQTVTVGVEIGGTLDTPKFSLFSNPDMSQEDILSYLVFGFPKSQANGNQYGAILSALSSLNPNTSNVGSMTKNIEDKLGLTEMGVESVQVFNPNATSNSDSVISATSLVLGKKISDDLSIHYSQGLFYPVSILNLRYKLTKNWAIQSETSTLDNGADILYSIERD